MTTARAAASMRTDRHGGRNTGSAPVSRVPRRRYPFLFMVPVSTDPTARSSSSRAVVGVDTMAVCVCIAWMSC